MLTHSLVCVMNEAITAGQAFLFEIIKINGQHHGYQEKAWFCQLKYM